MSRDVTVHVQHINGQMQKLDGVLSEVWSIFSACGVSLCCSSTVIPDFTASFITYSLSFDISIWHEIILKV